MPIAARYSVVLGVAAERQLRVGAVEKRLNSDRTDRLQALGDARTKELWFALGGGRWWCWVSAGVDVGRLPKETLRGCPARQNTAHVEMGCGASSSADVGPTATGSSLLLDVDMDIKITVRRGIIRFTLRCV